MSQQEVILAKPIKKSHPIYKDLVKHYLALIDENNMTWKGYFKDVVRVAKQECSINGNSSKK